MFNSGHTQPMINDLFYPIRHGDGAYVTALSNEVHNRPVFFPALEVVYREVNEFLSAEPTTEQHSEDGAVSFPLHCVQIRKLPKGASFVDGQPVSESHAELSCTLHAPDASGEVRAEQSRICCFVCQSSNRSEPHIDGSRSKQAFFEVNPVASYYRLVEGQPRLRAIPEDKIVNGASIAPL
jgi:hypothetical protein